jgi:NADPH:quinone reductase-like Zn-dependent oxidoreductase
MANMKLVRIHAFGGSNRLSLDDVPVPVPQDDEILIRIHAASVNPVDYKIRTGGYPAVDESKLPFPMGRDASGVAERIGKDVGSIAEGDALYAMSGMGHGTYAQFVIVNPNECCAKPQSLDHAHAAAIPLAALTAWQGLFDHGGVKQGQRVLIHGGAGGVGHLAVQFAKSVGAHVIATASGRDVEFVRELGADEAIDYQTSAFDRIVKEVDMVFDLIGGETRESSFKVLRRGGIMVSTLGEPSQDKAKEYGVRVAGYMAQPNAEQLARIAQLVDAGKVRVTICRSLALEDAGKAQDFLENEHVRGKIVLDIN